MWRGVFDRIASADAFARLLATMQRELRSWCEPVGQHGECLMAKAADAPPHPNAVVQLVVSLPQPTAVTDDRVATTKRTSSRQTLQRNYPGSTLSFVSGSAIKRITAGVKARR
jgi:hypothetical protein